MYLKEEKGKSNMSSHTSVNEFLKNAYIYN